MSERTGRSRGLIALIVVVVILLLGEAAVVTYVFVSPSAEENLQGVATSVRDAWEGTDEKPGIRTRVSRSFHRSYESWIVPLWHEQPVPGGNLEFTGCVECHPDYATKRRFDVYMNHPLHAELGVACATCHPQNIHPNPPLPLESTCAECHSEVEDRKQCGYCHPPASLPHFYLLGAPRQTVVQCDVCHPKNSFGVQNPTAKLHDTNFNGTDQQQCLSCHQQETCNACHQPPHPPGWLAVHGQGIAFGGGTTDCTSCHTVDWCATRCHSVTSLNPSRQYPLPPVGVRP